MTEQFIQLITTGGALGVLTVVFVLILRGDLYTKTAITASREGDARLIAEVSRDRDEWKTIAKDAVRESGELGEALTVRNRIDEDLLRRIGVTVKP